MSQGFRIQNLRSRSRHLRRSGTQEEQAADQLVVILRLNADREAALELDRKSTRLNSSHFLHDSLPIYLRSRSRHLRRSGTQEEQAADQLVVILRLNADREAALE